MPDPITRLNAALEGRYAIERELGEGGMATVYLADDLKHERKVALKVLKPELAAVVGAQRFPLPLHHPADQFLGLLAAESEMTVCEGNPVGDDRFERVQGEPVVLEE